MDKVEGLEAKIQEKIGRFVKHDPAADLVVYATKLSERTLVRPPVFGCEIILKTNYPANTFVVMKENENFYQAYDAAVAALMKMLRRRSAKEARHDRMKIRDFKEKMVRANNDSYSERQTA